MLFRAPPPTYTSGLTPIERGTRRGPKARGRLPRSRTCGSESFVPCTPAPRTGGSDCPPRPNPEAETSPAAPPRPAPPRLPLPALRSARSSPLPLLSLSLDCDGRARSGSGARSEPNTKRTSSILAPSSGALCRARSHQHRDARPAAMKNLQGQAGKDARRAEPGRGAAHGGHPGAQRTAGPNGDGIVRLRLAEACEAHGSRVPFLKLFACVISRCLEHGTAVCWIPLTPAGLWRAPESLPPARSSSSCRPEACAHTLARCPPSL